MRTLVTGGAGFIGSNLADALLDAGHEVTIVDNLSTGSKENIPDKADFFALDIADKQLADVFDRKQFDVVFHLAAQINVRASVADPAEDARINIVGSLNLLQESIKHKVSKVIFSSTGGAIYGEQDEFPAPETHPERPISPYGISKLALEKYLYYYQVQHGLDYAVLRYSNVYGPRQNTQGEAGVVAIFCDRLLRGQEVVVNGDGKQTRDFVFIEDVVRANLLAIGLKGSDIFNVGTGTEIDINTLFDKIAEAADSKQKRKNGPAMPGEQLRSSIACQKIDRHLKWKPSVDIDEGIKQTVAYFRSQTG